MKIITAAEWPMVSAALPPIRMLFDPLIPEYGKTLLHGPPGSGKSALMWGVGNAVAIGESYLGLATTQTNVLLISTDMSIYELKHRWGDSFLPKFDILAIAGFDCTNQQFAKSALYSLVQRHVADNNVKLVMIDALGGTHSGRSARDDETADLVDHSLSKWLPDVSLLLLGHDRKLRYSSDGAANEPSSEDFLGSQKWRANMTSQLHMWPVGEYISVLKHEKSQVAMRHEDQVRVYIDINGKAEAWSEHRSRQVVDMYQQAVQTLGLQNEPPMRQIAAIAAHYEKSERTIKRWRAMMLAGDRMSPVAHVTD